MKNAELISDRALLKQIGMGERFATECCIRRGDIENVAKRWMVQALDSDRRHEKELV